MSTIRLGFSGSRTSTAPAHVARAQHAARGAETPIRSSSRPILYGFPLRKAAASGAADFAGDLEKRGYGRRGVVRTRDQARLEQLVELAERDGDHASGEKTRHRLRHERHDGDIGEDAQLPVGVERLLAECRLEAGATTKTYKRVVETGCELAWKEDERFLCEGAQERPHARRPADVRRRAAQPPVRRESARRRAHPRSRGTARWRRRSFLRGAPDVTRAFHISSVSSSTSGFRCRSARPIAGNVSKRALQLNPTLTTPSSPAPARLADVTARSASASVRRAPSSSTRPASVSPTSRLLRSNRSVPSSVSSWRIATLSGGCAICSAAPRG